MLSIIYIFREGAAGWVPPDHPEPRHEGCGEGPERRPGVRGHWRTRSRHHLDQGRCPH